MKPSQYLKGKMSVFGETAAAIGLVNTSIHRIHQGFMLICSMWNFGKDADQLRRELEYEFFRFFMWEEHHEFSQLEVTVYQGESPAMAVKSSILREMESLLPKGAKFEERYKLKFEETHEEIEVKFDQGWLKLPPPLQRKFNTMAAKAIHSQNDTLKKLRWAIFDKDRMTTLVQDIHHQIDGLLEMTSLGVQNLILRLLTSMIRNGIKTSTNADDLEFLSQLSFLGTGPDNRWAIADASQLSGLKRNRIALGIDPLAVEEKQQASFVHIKKKRLEKLKYLKKRSAEYKTNTAWEPVGSGQELAVERGGGGGGGGGGSKGWVLLERRYVEMPSNNAEAERRRYQFESLAILLSELQSPSLHSLRCCGFYWADEAIALIYSLPPPTEPQADQTALPKIVSLSTVISDVTLKKADPATRRHIACALAEVITQLHTAGWLHKQIRPDNILLTNFVESRWPSIQSFQGPFLVGYGYARQNDPQGVSDEILEDPDVRLYRHPMAVQQGQSDRHKYRPRFDLYSMGMVLLEVALWKPLKGIVPGVFGLVKRQQSFESADVLVELKGKEVRDAVMAEIEYVEGSGFANAIQWCLDPGEFLQSTEGADHLDQDELLDITVSLQEAVLTTLQNGTI